MHVWSKSNKAGKDVNYDSIVRQQNCYKYIIEMLIHVREDHASNKQCEMDE